jgi:beta-lactamase superfamily II metal-dependent hydrolase
MDIFIHALDVGQGDAMILHQPDACTALIDAGPLGSGHRVTARIEELGIDALDMVIVSHPHLDHFGGLFDLLSRTQTRHFYDNGRENPAWEYFDNYRALRTGQPYRVLKQGDRLDCGDMRIDILHPPPSPEPGAGLNDNSLVFLISFGNFRMLHMGDLAGRAAEDFIAAHHELSADVLKIAHHGAADAASESLLTKVSPAHGVISTASVNRIGSPADSVLARLKDFEIRLFRTDLDGDIDIRVSQTDYRISASSTH